MNDTEAAMRCALGQHDGCRFEGVCGCACHSTLTEDERDWLADVWDEETTVSAGAFYPVVARIVAARVAAAHADAVLAEIAEERKRQTAKHGDQSHLPDGTGPYALGGLVADDRHTYAAGLARWAKARTDAAAQRGGDGSVTFEHILTEEWAEAMAESDETALRAELVQVAAVAVQWIEAIDLRAAVADPEPPAPWCPECGPTCPLHGEPPNACPSCALGQHRCTRDLAPCDCRECA